jgi:NAD(P)-dependent dehydrogenase (short-subunit alcohol dehydrogenase family)
MRPKRNAGGMMMTGRFESKVALVTGGSSGIGRTSALAFAREGAKVVVADVNVEGGLETVQMIKRGGGEAIFVRTDVSKAVDAERMVSEAVETYNRLDCAYNNAGYEGLLAPIAEYTEEDWDRVMNINLKGVWLCMKYEVTCMLQHGGGAIVNTASVAGLVGFARTAVYAASKVGVVGLTKSAALSYAGRGIRINAVCPGFIDTPMLDRLLGNDPQRIAQRIADTPVGRLGTPKDIAEAVIWLCSDSASFVTGHALVADGGFLAYGVA